MKRKLKFLYQRLTRGWDDSDTWSLSTTVSEFVLPRLKRYKEINIVDWSRYDLEEGCDIINELIWYHETVAKDDLWSMSDFDQERFNKASILWGKYYMAIWW